MPAPRHARPQGFSSEVVSAMRHPASAAGQGFFEAGQPTARLCRFPGDLSHFIHILKPWPAFQGRGAVIQKKVPRQEETGAQAIEFPETFVRSV